MSDNLFKETILAFGQDAQWLQLIEECGELIAAINQVVFRGRDDYNRILEEVAGVELMINQIKYMLNCPVLFKLAYENEKNKCWKAVKDHEENKKEGFEEAPFTEGSFTTDSSEQGSEG